MIFKKGLNRNIIKFPITINLKSRIGLILLPKLELECGALKFYIFRCPFLFWICDSIWSNEYYLIYCRNHSELLNITVSKYLLVSTSVTYHSLDPLILATIMLNMFYILFKNHHREQTTSGYCNFLNNIFFLKCHKCLAYVYIIL